MQGGQQEAEPAQLGLDEPELPPGQRGGHWGQGRDAEDDRHQVADDPGPQVQALPRADPVLLPGDPGHGVPVPGHVQGPGDGHQVIGGGVEQRVEGGVHRGGEQHQEAELLPHPEPGVQPAGEHRVLGASGKLQIRRQDTCNGSSAKVSNNI